MINAVNNINIATLISPRNNPNFRKTEPLGRDTISFKRRQDLLKNKPETIIRKLKETVRNENLIGEGGEAVVYKIPTSQYCFRLVMDDYYHGLQKSINFDITEQDKINHVVAKVGKNGSTIQKFISGSPVRDPHMSEIKQRQISEEIANMPIESFSKLIKQICNAYNNGMMFDCHWANILVSPKKNSITAIDFYKMNEPENLYPLNFCFSGLTHNNTPIEHKKTIAGKIILAGLKEFELGTIPTLNVGEYDFERFAHKLFNEEIIKKPNYRKIMISTFEKIKNLKYNETENRDKMEGQINIAKALVKQLLGVS